MKIGIFGTGYVGLISAVCLANNGHTIVAYDLRKDVIDDLCRGKASLYEQGLEELLQRVLAKKTISFCSKSDGLRDCEVVFLSVGTPPLPDGSADLTQVFAALDELLKILPHTTLIAIRSTMPVGTNKIIRKRLSDLGRTNQVYGFCPEFLREGSAVYDFMNPDYLVFASDSQQGIQLLQDLYAPIVGLQEKKAKIMTTSNFETAELIKYSINSFLAIKVTFINQIAQLAQQSGADIKDLIGVISADKRIGKQFITPGPGFGGSCLPKDTKALVQNGRKFGVDLSLIEVLGDANKKHKQYIVSWILSTLQETKKQAQRIGIWGLSFKAGTDDIRESSALQIVSELLQSGKTVYAHDPKGMGNFRRECKGNDEKLHFVDDALLLLKEVDALVILTEWNEYRDFFSERLQERFSNLVVFDTRGICSDKKLREAGISLHRFGIRPTS